MNKYRLETQEVRMKLQQFLDFAKNKKSQAYDDSTHDMQDDEHGGLLMMHQ